jgi:hypothetical protein
MSADLIDDLTDENGVKLEMFMNARGHAFLTLYGGKDHEPDPGPDMVTLHLPPTSEGHAQAEAIERALKAWREQTKEAK